MEAGGEGGKKTEEKDGRHNREKEYLKSQQLKCRVSLFLLKGPAFHTRCYPYQAPAYIPASAAAALGPPRSSCTGKRCTSHLAGILLK